MRTLANYIGRRLISYTAACTGVLTILATLIEFVERFLRTQQADTRSIYHYALLQLIPNFFAYLPMATGLASILVLRELYTRGEWELTHILGIGPNKLAKHFTGITCILMLSAVIANETIGHCLARKANAIRLSVFKQVDTSSIHGAWCTVHTNDVCYLQHLNIKAGTGLGLVYVEPNKEHTHTIITYALQVQYNSTTHTITAPLAHSTNTATGITNIISDLHITIPALGWQQLLANEQIPLVRIAQQLVIAPSSLPPAITSALRYRLVRGLIQYLHIPLYPLIILAFFVIAPTGILGLALRGLPFLLLTGLPILFESLGGTSTWPLFILVHLLLFIFCWCILRRRHKDDR